MPDRLPGDKASHNTKAHIMKITITVQPDGSLHVKPYDQIRDLPREMAVALLDEAADALTALRLELHPVTDEEIFEDA
jgi:hypothetical protein